MEEITMPAAPFWNCSSMSTGQPCFAGSLAAVRSEPTALNDIAFIHVTPSGNGLGDVERAKPIFTAPRWGLGPGC